MEYSTSGEYLTRPNENVRTTVPFVPFSLNMLKCDKNVVLKDFKKITLSLQISCNRNTEFTRPDLDTNLGTAPESARICLIRSMGGPYNRWLSNRGIELKRGRFNITISFDEGSEESEWCSVYGKRPRHSPQSMNGFKGCLENPVEIAVVFGGGNHYGHGVSVKRPHEAILTIHSLLLS